MATVTLDHVSFTYPGSSTPVIVDMNLQIEHGSAHALLGASGVGKTTILGLLSGLLHPGSGSIRIDSRDVSAEGARKRNVAQVFQFPVTYESIPVLENLTVPLTSRGWSTAEAATRAREISRELDIDHVLAATPDQLPLFETQLVAIGKALVRDDVDLVLLDEPLTAVEPAIKWQVRQTLNKFQAAHDLTMVYVTHDQTEALTYADSVSVIADGTILQTGTPASIYHQPASPFVGEFVGSPGMQFVTCLVRGGRLTVASQMLRHVDVEDGQYLLGVRPDWIGLSTNGPWRIAASQVLGTQSGIAVSMHRITHPDGSLLARHVGEFALDSSVSLTLDHFTLFLGDEAVVHE